MRLFPSLAVCRLSVWDTEDVPLVDPLRLRYIRHSWSICLEHHPWRSHWGTCPDHRGMLIDQDMKKRDLEKAAGISHYTINKLNHGDNVTTDVLGKICMALNCTIDDIMEFVDE